MKRTNDFGNAFMNSNEKEVQQVSNEILQATEKDSRHSGSKCEAELTVEEFEITVRKLVIPAKPRGVLAE
jgi:hypothetical protein